MGLVSGIVGAGGNVGGMLFGFLFKNKDITYAEAFSYIGIIVTAVSVIVLVTKFSKEKSADKKTKAVFQPALANNPAASIH